MNVLGFEVAELQLSGVFTYQQYFSSVVEASVTTYGKE